MSNEVYAPPIKLENETLPVGLRKVFAQAGMVRAFLGESKRTHLSLYAKDYDALAHHLNGRYSRDGMGRLIAGEKPIHRATWHGLPVKRIGA